MRLPHGLLSAAAILSGALACVGVAGTANAAVSGPGPIALSAKPSVCLDVVNGNQASGTNVQVYTCNNTSAQQWKYDTATQTIKSAGGYCLDNSGGTIANNNNIQIYTCNATSAQKWVYVPATGAIQLAVNPAYCVDVQGGGLASGTNVILYTCHGGANQRWLAPSVFTTVTPVITGPVSGSSTANAQPPISGTGNPGDTVTVKDGSGNTVCTAAVQANGTWTCSPAEPLGPGQQSLTPTATGPQGTATGSAVSEYILPKLVITKSVAPSDQVNPGDTVTYTVTVTNPSAADYANANFTDNLADVLRSATWNNALSASSGTASFANQAVTWSGTVPAGTSTTVTYSVTAN